jgi:adenylate cyclase
MEPAGPRRVERRIAAILATDVAGCSRLIGADEEGTLGRLKALRPEGIDPKIAGHHGRIVKTTGDGLLVEFASVVDALRCAAEVQAAMAKGNAPLPPDHRIEFRIGTTSATSSSRTVTPSATASTSRSGSKARPSRAASASWHAFRKMLRVASSSRTSPARCASTGFARLPPKILQHQLNRLCRSRQAVDRGPALGEYERRPGAEYFADGMVEEIITALSRIRWLCVIARASRFTYKGAIDVRRVGREVRALPIHPGLI